VAPRGTSDRSDSAATRDISSQGEKPKIEEMCGKTEKLDSERGAGRRGDHSAPSEPSFRQRRDDIETHYNI